MRKPQLALRMVAAFFVLICFCSCDGSGEKNTGVSGRAASVDVLGTYMVEGQSAMVYHLTVYPDDTFVMTYKGSAFTGRYVLSGNALTLNLNSGPTKRLQVESGGNRLIEQETGGVIWLKI
jgi:hypothetical protein